MWKREWGMLAHSTVPAGMLRWTLGSLTVTCAKPQDSQQKTVITVPILFKANLKYPEVKSHMFKCNTWSNVSSNEPIQTLPAVTYSSEECRGHPEFL